MCSGNCPVMDFNSNLIATRAMNSFFYQISKDCIKIVL